MSCCGCHGWIDPDRFVKGVWFRDTSNEAFGMTGLGALRQAVRCELYNPSRRSSRPTSPRAALYLTLGSAADNYALNWRRFGLATTSGSDVGLARPALGA